MNPPVERRRTDPDTAKLRVVFNTFIDGREKELEDLKKKNLDNETRLKIYYEGRLKQEFGRSRNLCKKNSNLETRLGDCESRLNKVLDEKMKISEEFDHLKAERQKLSEQLSDWYKYANECSAKLEDARISYEKEKSAVAELTASLQDMQKQFEQTTAENVSLKQQSVETEKKDLLKTKELDDLKAEKKVMLVKMSKWNKYAKQCLAKLQDASKCHEQEKLELTTSLQEMQKQWDTVKEEMSTEHDHSMVQVSWLEKELKDAHALWKDEMLTVQLKLFEAEVNLEKQTCELQKKSQEHKADMLNLNLQLQLKTDELELNKWQLKQNCEMMERQAEEFLQIKRMLKMKCSGQKVQVESAKDAEPPEKRARGVDVTPTNFNPENAQAATALGFGNLIKLEQPSSFQDPNK